MVDRVDRGGEAARARAGNATSAWLKKMLKLINLKWLEMAFNLHLLIRVYTEQNLSEPEIRLSLTKKHLCD